MTVDDGVVDAVFGDGLGLAVDDTAEVQKFAADVAKDTDWPEGPLGGKADETQTPKSSTDIEKAVVVQTDPDPLDDEADQHVLEAVLANAPKNNVPRSGGHKRICS